MQQHFQFLIMRGDKKASKSVLSEALKKGFFKNLEIPEEAILTNLKKPTNFAYARIGGFSLQVISDVQFKKSKKDMMIHEDRFSKEHKNYLIKIYRSS